MDKRMETDGRADGGMDGRTNTARCTQIFLKETFGCHIPIYRIMLLRKNSFDSLNLFNYDYMDEFLAGTDW